MAYNSDYHVMQFCNGSLWIAAGGAGGSLSSLTAGTINNTIDSTLYTQTWNWSTLATATSGLSLNATNAAGGANSTLTVTNTTTGAGFGVASTLSDAANTGYALYGSNASAGGYGVYSNGAAKVAGALTVTGATTLSGLSSAGVVLNSAAGLLSTSGGALAVANGGTGLASGTQYGLPYFATTTSMGSTAAGTTTTLLHGNASGSPAWSAVGLTADVTGTLPVGNGGTGIASGTQYGIPYFSTTTLMASTGAGTTTTVLHGNAAGAPSWSALNLGTDITGTLPVANGGTGLASYTIGDIPYASASTTFSKLADAATGNALISGGVGAAPSWGKIDLTAAVTGSLPVANGGTGATAFTQGSVVFAGASGVYSQDNANFFWDATNHRLGIGTTGPQTALNLIGTGVIQVGANTDTVYSQLANTFLDLERAGSTYVVNGNASGSSLLRLGVGSISVNSNGITINSTGNVGIGTTSPARALVVTTSGQGPVGFDSTSGLGTFINLTSSGTNRGNIGYSPQGSTGLAIADTSGVPQLLVTPAGLVGIGTTSPGFPLTIKAADLGDQISLRNSTYEIQRVGSSSAANAGATALFNAGVNTIYLDAGTNRNSYFNSGGFVGIGTTSPDAALTVSGTNAITVQRSGLAAEGDILIGSGGEFRFGTADYGRAMQITPDGGNIYYYANNNTTANTTAAVMTILQSGKVGIGTTTPMEKLHISGTSIATTYNSATSYGNANAVIEGTDTGRTAGKGGVLAFAYPVNSAGTTWEQARIVGGADNATNSDVSGRLTLQTRYYDGSSWNWNTGLVLNHNGYVGIGTTSPLYKAEIVGASGAPAGSSGNGIFALTTGTGINTDSAMQFGIVDSSYGWIQSVKPGSNALNLVLNGSGGNVGIGTTSPGAPLDVEVNQDAATMIKVGNTFNTSTGSALLLASAQNNGVDLYATADAFSRPYPGFHSGAVSLIGSSTNGLNIISNIGTGTIGANTGMIRFIAYNGVGGITSNTSGNDAATRMVINASGHVGIGTTSPSYTLHVNGTAYATGAAGALSDRRHKKDIKPLALDALDIVSKLKPVTFLWKKPADDGMKGRQFGFIAQDVQPIVPDIVLTQQNKEKTLGLKYDDFIPILTKAIQELKAVNDNEASEIKQLKAANDNEAAEIKLLKANNDALKADNKEFRAEFEAFKVHPWRIVPNLPKPGKQ